MNVLLVDNYDSFTYNLYQYLGEVFGAVPVVIRNDDKLPELSEFDAIVISPGPGAPWEASDFGICKHIIQHCSQPLLGICLGHQGIVDAHDGVVGLAETPYHGRTSKIIHDQAGLFAQLPNPLNAVRYHSLVATEPLPDDLRVTARSECGLIMGVEHKHKPIWGVQFHPESVSTEHGRQILMNFRTLAEASAPVRGREPQFFSSSSPAHPSHRKEARERAWQCHYRELRSSVSAEHVFERFFKDSEYSFWLDSSSWEGLQRPFSFMGDTSSPGSYWFEYSCGGALEIRHSDGTVTSYEGGLSNFLKEVSSSGVKGDGTLPFDFCGGVVGYQGYELKSETESQLNTHVSHLPDSAGIFADRFLAFDHVGGRIFVVGVYKSGTAPEPTEAWVNKMVDALDGLSEEAVDPAAGDTLQKDGNGGNQEQQDVMFLLEAGKSRYLDKIEQCKHYIALGESYEICLTNRLRTSTPTDTFSLYKTLRAINPAPRSAYLHTPDYSVISSSPEKFVSVNRNRVVEAKPIKGTRKRGGTRDEDVALAAELRASEKDRAENLMIADLLRNDLNRVCEVGSVWVPKLMDVETYASVHQLVSTVRGQLRQDATAADLLYATFPPGSMTGAPKRRTLEIIDGLEDSARGIYSGAIGYFSINGTADLNVAIRTIVACGDELEIGVGGAVTWLSDAEDEYQEILVKGNALMRAIARYATGDSERFKLVESEEVLNEWPASNVSGAAETNPEPEVLSLLTGAGS